MYKHSHFWEEIGQAYNSKLYFFQREMGSLKYLLNIVNTAGKEEGERGSDGSL